ncbi:calphotin-like isoform X1 [Daphnia carinata]|uniref:calphotin-like isoform X1 n=1 Tax=Daphnia carinata TaxID=120202 RepID=UPI00257B186A|nr:calphotin-like isoform X1 [Daphnia carinata]
MAPEKFALVLAVFLSAAFGQMFNQDVMESKHRAVGYRLPPPMYVRQQGLNYNIHHAQHFTSNPIPVRRPPGPVHHLRPAHVVPHVHHLPAYQIPFPAPRQTSNYAVPVLPTRTYPVPLASRPYVTTPRPVFPSPVHPTRPPYSVPNYVNPQHAPVAPPSPVRPVPTRAPFYPSPPTPKPAPSLLDLPWVKPLYARNQVTPKPYYYGNPSTWHLQTKEVQPATVVIKQEDTGVSISSVGSPLPETAANTLPSAVANDDSVREIPQEVTAFNVPAPVSVATTTQRPINGIISDDSGEDIRVIQEVNTPAPLRTTPSAIIQQIPAADLRVSLPMTTAMPATQLVLLDDSAEDVRFIQQELPVPATASVSAPVAVPLPILDDSGEDFRIVQQVQISNVPVTSPRTPTTTATSPGTNMAEGLGLRNVPQEMSLSPLSVTSPVATAPQVQTISLVVSDESGEDILRQVPVANGPVVGPRLTATARPDVSVVVVDSSDEDVGLERLSQQGRMPLLPAANSGIVATQPPRVSVSISDNSNEDLRIVQLVPVSNAPVSSAPVINVAVPTSRSAMTGTSSFTVVDTSDEDIVLRNVPQEVNQPPASATRPLSVFDDSVEDLRIVQQVRVPNVSVRPPSTTTRPGVSFVVLDRSDEDVERIRQQTSRPLSSVTNPGTLTQQPAFTSVSISDNSEEDLRIVQRVSVSNAPVPNVPTSLTGTSTFTVVDTSEEDIVLRNVPQEVNRRLSSTSRPIVPATVLDDSVEDLRIVQVPVSNVQATSPSTMTRPGPSFVVLDRSEEDVLLRNIPQQTISLSSASASVPATRAPNRPLVFLDNSVEDVQIVRQGTIANTGTSSLQAVLANIEGNSLEVPDNSNEDFELRLISQPISVPTLSSPGPLQSTTTPRVLLVDSDEDVQIVQEILLSGNSTSRRVGETPRIFLRDSAEDFQTNRRVPQPTVSLSGSGQSAGVAPLLRLVDSAEDIQVTREVSLSSVPLSARAPTTGQTQPSFLVDSAEDIQIVRQIAFSNTSSPGTVAETPRIFLRDSAEDFQIDRRIPQSSVSLSGPAQSAGTSPLVRLVDSDEDVQVARNVPLSTIVLSTPVSSTGQTPLSFLVDSEEDTRIVQGNLLSNVSLSGPAATGAGSTVLLVDSAEDTQEFLRSNVSLSSTTASRIVLVESAEDIESPVLPLLQAANRVQIQEREFDDDRSEEDIQTRLTISGGSIVLVNPTSV